MIHIMLLILAKYFTNTIGVSLHELARSRNNDPREMDIDYIRLVNDYNSLLVNKDNMKNVFSDYKVLVNYDTGIKHSDSELLGKFLKELLSPSVYNEISKRELVRYELWTGFVKSVVSTITKKIETGTDDIHRADYTKVLFDNIRETITNVRTQFAYKISTRRNNVPETEIESENKINNIRILDENTKLKKQIAKLNEEIEKLNNEIKTLKEKTKPEDKCDEIVITEISDLEGL